MGLRFCSLASGSDGNCAYVASATTAVLLDAGLTAKETERRLGLIGATLAEIRAICVTHEHADHIAGLDVLHRRSGIPLYANSGTIEAIEAGRNAPPLPWRVFSNGAPFVIGDLEMIPFSVPHDSYDPVAFVVRCGDVRLGVVTDVGTVTGLVRERLKGCRLLMIEANHDRGMLKDSARPWSLKQRISGRQGHLSNEGAAELVADIAGGPLTHVFLAHLSVQCNSPELAVKTVRRALEKRGIGHVSVSVASCDQVSDLWTAG